jgi:hypothetical protein
LNARAAPVLSLPLALIGPRAQGRSYRVLATSPGFKPSDEAQAALTDVALVLAAWAERKGGAFAMLVPLDRSGLSLLLRARYVGRAELGHVARAVGVFIDAAAAEALGRRPHRLLARLPDDLPEEGFGPLVVDVADLDAPKETFPDIGLAWEDLAVDAGESDPEALLSGLLEAVSPEPQRERITGWATSGSLTRKGGFNPSTTFNLIVHAPGDAATVDEAPGRRRGELQSLRKFTPPKAWSAWRRFTTLDALPWAAAQRLSAAKWTLGSAQLRPEDVVALAAVDACVALTTADRVALLLRMANEAYEGFDKAFDRTFEALARATTTPAQLAAYLGCFLAKADRKSLDSLARVLDLFADFEVLKLLELPEIKTLLPLGLTAALARRGAVPETRSPVAEMLLADACRRAPLSPEIRAFAGDLTRAAAETEYEDGFGAAEAAIDALLALPPAPEDRRLAAPAVAAMVGAEAQRRALSARAVRPVLRDPKGGRELRDALLAGLVLERTLEASA